MSTPLDMIAISRMWLLSIQNVSSETEELNFQFFNFNLFKFKQPFVVSVYYVGKHSSVASSLLDSFTQISTGIPQFLTHPPPISSPLISHLRQQHQQYTQYTQHPRIFSLTFSTSQKVKRKSPVVICRHKRNLEVHSS